MRDVLTLPELGVGARSAGSAPEDRDSLAALLRQTGDADPVAGAIARLVGQHGAGSDGPMPRQDLLYALAAAAVADGRVAQAVAPLAALAAAPGRRAEALLGLAVCATRLGCYEDGLILAEEARRLTPGHPRASCAAGLCALELGNRRAAQGHLATAARLARRDAAHSEDLRLAQRALLLMHLA